MDRILFLCFVVTALTVGASAQESRVAAPPKKAAAPGKQLQLKDLPLAVRKTIQDEAKGAKIRQTGKETEHGVAQYEVEYILNGKHRDFNVDTKGALLLVEEETTFDSIPAAVKVAILKKVADGKLGMVELFKRGGETMHEAGYISKNGKTHEVLVKADGTETKDLARDATGVARDLRAGPLCV
jgi:hypothetical protein